jgi:hypothetical protein
MERWLCVAGAIALMGCSSSSPGTGPATDAGYDQSLPDVNLNLPTESGTADGPDFCVGPDSGLILQPPVFVLVSGTEFDAGPASITIRAPANLPSDGVVFYTTSGTAPSCTCGTATCTGSQYKAPLSIQADAGPVTVYAIAAAPGYGPSTAAYATYSFYSPPPIDASAD